MKKIMTIAAVALMTAAGAAYACSSCGCESKKADKEESKCGSCKAEKNQTACSGASKSDKAHTDHAA